MEHSENCIFCKIISGDIASEFLFQDEALVAFKDIKPIAPVHVLIVPKKHVRSINDLTAGDEALISRMIMAAKDLAKQTGVNKSGYRLFFNVEKGGGQEIFHLHLHLIGGWV